MYCSELVTSTWTFPFILLHSTVFNLCLPTHNSKFLRFNRLIINFHKYLPLRMFLVRYEEEIWERACVPEWQRDVLESTRADIVLISESFLRLDNA